MTKFFDNLETRSGDERARDLSIQLPSQIKNAKENSKAFKEILKDVAYQDITSIESLTKLSNKLNLGLISPKLLFDILRVFI